jgi:hypothetical protein
MLPFTETAEEKELGGVACIAAGVTRHFGCSVQRLEVRLKRV